MFGLTMNSNNFTSNQLLFHTDTLNFPVNMLAKHVYVVNVKDIYRHIWRVNAQVLEMDKKCDAKSQLYCIKTLLNEHNHTTSIRVFKHYTA